MGFFEELGDIIDPCGITDFDGNGTHDIVESMIAVDLVNEVINEDDDDDKDSK